MTDRNGRIVRHIPEEELHAYLDQALSRSQCVEIESHLAKCADCRDERDAIAALRDRTTALLARIGPPPIVPPAFEVIEERYGRVHQRRVWMARAGRAASVLIAISLGWQAHDLIHPNTPPTPSSATTALATTGDTGAPHAAPPALTPTPDTAPTTPATPAHQPARRPTRPTSPASQPSTIRLADGPSRESAAPVLASFTEGDGRERVSLEVSSLASDPKSESDVGFTGLWRKLPLDEASRRGENQLPRVFGLPVLQVQVRPDSADQEIMAVDQQLATGEVIRTIEGPAASVSTLIRESNPRDQMTLTVRQGDRMIAVQGPSAVLGSLMSRVNTRRRY